MAARAQPNRHAPTHHEEPTKKVTTKSMDDLVVKVNLALGLSS